MSILLTDYACWILRVPSLMSIIFCYQANIVWTVFADYTMIELSINRIDDLNSCVRKKRWMVKEWNFAS